MTQTIPQTVINTIGYKPSDEQVEIVNALFTDELPKLTVSAAAGSGKTSTLLLLAHMAQEQDIVPNVLYLVFSKAMQLESEAKFKGLAEVRTIDAIALQLIGGKTPVKVQLKSRDGYWFNSHIFDICGHPKGRNGFGYIKGRDTIPDITNYIARESYVLGQYDGLAARNLYKVQANFNDVLMSCHYPDAWLRLCEEKYRDSDTADYMFAATYLGVLEAFVRLYKTGETTFSLNTFALSAANAITDSWIENITSSLPRTNAVLNRVAEYKRAVAHYRDMSDVALVNTLILVDEAQDLSPAKLAMTKAMIGANTQIAYVGDKMQAIFAFCGADNQSFDKIIDFCDGNVLPLSTCYRCDREIVEWAQDYREDIRSRDGAGLGHVDYVKSVRQIDFEDWLFDDSISRLLITRNNAPLTNTFLSLYRSGIKFKMSDRKITSIVDDGVRVYNCYAEDAGLIAVKTPKQWHNINSRTISAVIAEIDYQLGRAEEVHEIETLKSHSEELHGFSLLFGMFGSGTDDQGHMIDKMRKALIDNSSTLLLSTAHGSKGLEADSVIVLGWDKFVTMDPTDWQFKRFTPEEIEQEQHLSYVAGTRAKHDLCFSISSEVEYCYGNMEVAA
jgi:AAA domain